MSTFTKVYLPTFDLMGHIVDIVQLVFNLNVNFQFF